jgi:Nucleotidyltransferase of unknown function (DUF6036)
VTEPDDVLLGRAEIERAFTALGERLARRGVVADVFVVGGAAMALAYDAARVTRDVDAVFKPHGIVLEEARNVADDLGLPYWWLNEQASVYISGKEDASKRRVFDHPGLRVMAASPAHVFAMKARAARTRDIDDLRLLADIIGVDSAGTALRYARTSTLTNPYPRDQPPCFRSFSADDSETLRRVLKRYRAASSAAVSTAHAYGAATRAFSQRATNCGAAARAWVSPVLLQN